jgi:hypothetical protein
MDTTTINRPTTGQFGLTTEDIFTAVPSETPVAKQYLSFREAVDAIEGRTTVGEQYRRVKVSIEKYITETSDQEQIGIGYYYLIRVALLDRTFRETSQMRTLYAKLHTAFLTAEANYKAEFRRTPKKERDLISRQFEAFYQIIDSYMKALELIYDERGFQHGRDHIHADRMRFRRRASLQAGQHIVHLGHLFMEHTSNYGHSFVRWGVTVALFVFLFACAYFVLDNIVAGGAIHGIHNTKNFLDYLYFSVVVLTTIGFGDLTPLGIARLFAGIEGILGYIMLGIFLTLIQKRL